MPALATSLGTVCNAIHRFRSEAGRSTQLAGRLAYARAWYACRDRDGRWQFGPSKFVGYERLTAEQYLERSRKGLDGRRTETQLQRWFKELDPSSALHEELSAQLSAFLAEHGKAPSRKMRISIPERDYDELLGNARGRETGPILELLVAVAESLPRSDLDTLRKRLIAIGR